MKYVVNGVPVPREGFLIHRKNEKKVMMAEVLESRTPPGGHEPYWKAGFESLSSGVPQGQAKERQEQLEKAGITGCRMRKDGIVEINSPGSADKLQKHLGLVSQNTAGTAQFAGATTKKAIAHVTKTQKASTG